MPPTFFSYANGQRAAPLAPGLVTCYRTFTNPRTHALVAASQDKLPAYESEGVGPRYCPSINIKVQRFPERDQHYIWLEPEGLTTDIVYPNGISGAFEEAVQEELVRTIAGLEAAVILRPGYDVEYDFIDPRVLRASLEVRSLPGLFLAGQIIGTTGYEEAAALGLYAGIHAARNALGRQAPFTLGRADAYLGVLVDDLVTRGTMEPYRMFTSRAEHRLLLRADNADLRLTERAAELGLISDTRLQACIQKREAVATADAALHSFTLPATDWIRAGAPITHGPPRTAAFALSLAGVSLDDVEAWAAAAAAPSQGPAAACEASAASGGAVEEVEEVEAVDQVEAVGGAGTRVARLDPVPAYARETVEVSVKYAEPLQRQERNIERIRRASGAKLPEDFDYANVRALSNEEVQKLTAARPQTLQEASEISGVTPNGIAALLVALRNANTEGATPRDDLGQPATRSSRDQQEKTRRRALAAAAKKAAAVEARPGA